MSSLSSLYGDLRYYQKLLSDTYSLSGTVGQAIDALDPAISKIDSCFQIDEVSADLKQISNCREKLHNHKCYLSSTAIPAIERKISSIRREIEKLEEEELALMTPSVQNGEID